MTFVPRATASSVASGAQLHPHNYGSCFDVVTQHNDLGRTGASTCETVLTPRSVSAGSFGKLFSRAVDGQVYADILYLNQVAIGKYAPGNVIVVATMNNSIYVFDADNPAAQDPLWQTHLGPPVPATDYKSNLTQAYSDILGTVGELGTPTIDKEKGLIYAVAALKESTGANATYRHTLNVLSLVDGSMAHDPVTITAAVAGTSDDAVEGVITFNSLQHLARPGLTLTGGQIIVTFGSHGDDPPDHGWGMSYDATTLEQTGVFCSTVHSQGGAIWQSGQGPAVGNNGAVFVATGNGLHTDATQPDERAQSLIRLDLKPGVLMTDYFTPANYANLSAQDGDFGSSGPMIPPGSGRVIVGSKAGTLYNVAQDNMGTLQAGDPQTQEVTASTHGLFGAPVYWGGANPPQVYVWPAGDSLKSFAFVNKQVSTTAVQTNAQAVSQAGVPGGILSVSADGDTAHSGIIWANLALTGNANQATQPGVLKAYAADNISQLLWSSDSVPADALGSFAKFTSATVVNGKVYVPTFSNEVVVYGLRANIAANHTTPSNSTTMQPATDTESRLGTRPATQVPYTNLSSIAATSSAARTTSVNSLRNTTTSVLAGMWGSSTMPSAMMTPQSTQVSANAGVRTRTVLPLPQTSVSLTTVNGSTSTTTRPLGVTRTDPMGSLMGTSVTAASISASLSLGSQTGPMALATSNVSHALTPTPFRGAAVGANPVPTFALALMLMRGLLG